MLVFGVLKVCVQHFITPGYAAPQIDLKEEEEEEERQQIQHFRVKLSLQTICISVMCTSKTKV